MRLPIHVVLLGLVANAFGLGNSYLSAQRAGIARTPIFRYIDVRPYGVLQLGKAFDSTAILGVALRPGVFRLDRKDGQPVQLGDTRAILVARLPGGPICAMHFLYVPNKTFEEAVADYRSDFGPPRLERGDTARRLVQSASWRDAQTRLSVRQTSSQGATAISAVLEPLSIGV